jgi:hypothetical protein
MKICCVIYQLGVVLTTVNAVLAQSPNPAPTQHVPGPVAGTKITEAYARTIMRDAFFWVWPMINCYNKRLAFAQIPEPGLMNGALPTAPLNRLCMLTDYTEPTERWVACPNQDVVYGGGGVALDVSPVVFQVPDFGNRFWVYQAVDLRTDSFVDLGSMYGTNPGFYLLVGPNWNGEVPKGITKVFRSKTNSGVVGPRVFVDDTPEDKRAVQELVSQIDMYPLTEFDGKVKCHDWSKVPKFPGAESKEEVRWVFPDKFLDQLPRVLRDAPPLPGEEARYEEMLFVAAAAEKDPALKAAIVDEVTKADKDLVGPLLQFRNWGIQLPSNWSTTTNGAAFGTDYFTRTAVAKSNILVNKPNEAKYFYQDLDVSGGRLNGNNRYTMTFAKGQTPPVKGFWSLTLYNEQHFFEPNPIKRYSVGTKNKNLQVGADGSLTIYVQADEPRDPGQRKNWLPSPKNKDFSLFLRAYWAEPAALDGSWTPPAVEKAK